MDAWAVAAALLAVADTNVRHEEDWTIWNFEHHPRRQWEILYRSCRYRRCRRHRCRLNH